MGPVKQIKKMFDPTRLTATILVFLSIALTLVSAVVVSTLLQYNGSLVKISSGRGSHLMK